jgi:hypothetical protein
MILLRIREFAPRPPFMPDRGLQAIETCWKNCRDLLPCNGVDLFDIAGNAPARRGSDWILVLSFVRESFRIAKGIAKRHGGHHARGAETSPGWRVGDPALVLRTVPVVAQISANRREPRAGRRPRPLHIISNPYFNPARARLELAPHRRPGSRICGATALAVHSDPWPQVGAPCRKG